MNARFADPALCSNCRTPRTEQDRCWNCQIWLTGPDGGRLAALMAEADDLLGRLRAAAAQRQPGGFVPPPIDVSPRERYAEAAACPACRHPVSGQRRCTTCGIDLSGAEGARLWAVLNDIDVTLSTLRAEAASVQVPAPARPQTPPAPRPEAPSPPPPGRPEAGPEPASGSTPPVSRGFDVGSALLALGALCVVVAGFIFISVSWDTMSLAARTWTLTAVTAIAGACAAFAVVRGLRGSAEALSWVFLGLLTFDYAAATVEGMLGLDQLSEPHQRLLLGAGLIAVSTALAVWTRAALGARIWATRAGMVGGLAALATGTELPGDAVWSALAATAVSLLVLAGFARARFAVTAQIGLIVPFFALLAAQGLVIGRLIERPGYREVWLDGGALAAFALVGLLIATALVFERATGPATRAMVPLVVIVATGITVLNLAALLFVPFVSDERLEAAQLSIVGLALVVTSLGIVVPKDWGTGVRVAALGLWTGVGFFAATWLAAFGLSTTGAGGDATWTATAEPLDSDLMAAWMPPLGLVAAGVLPVIAAQWQSWFPADGRLAAEAGRWIPAWATAVLVVAAAMAVALTGGPLAVVAAIALVTGLGYVLMRSADDVWTVALAYLLVAVACFVPVAVQGLAGATWIAGAAVVAVLALRTTRSSLRPASLLFAVILAFLGGLNLAGFLGLDAPVITLLGMVFAAALLLAGQAFAPGAWRIGWEVMAGTMAFFALTAGSVESAGWQAGLWAIAAAALTATGLLRSDRAWMKATSLVPWAVAYLLAIYAAEITEIEVYTVPLALALLGLGAWSWGQRPRLSSLLALGPGLAVGLVPSLLLALEDVTSLRALILGLVALGLIIGGVHRNWFAPFGFGLGLGATLVIVSVGPYANAVPRWGVIGTAGVILLALGATFEARVKNAKAAIRYLSDMR